MKKIEVKKKEEKAEKQNEGSGCREIIPASFLRFLLRRQMLRNAPRAFRAFPLRRFLRTMINKSHGDLFMKIWFGFLNMHAICVWRGFFNLCDGNFSGYGWLYGDFLKIFLILIIYIYTWGGSFISCDAYMLCTTFLMAACFTRRSGNAFSPPILRHLSA